MGEKTQASIFGKALNRIQKIGLFFLKLIYIIPFIVFGFWLISIVYFHGFDINASISKYKKDDDTFQIVSQKKGPVPREHFHMIDAYVERQELNPPICVVCHGTYAHGKEKKVRSILNMHTGFISCSVCHARQDGASGGEKATPENDRIEFLWVDRETGEFKNTVKGEYGKFPAMIHPIKHTEQGPRQIFTPIKAEAAQQFLKMRPELTPDQVSEAKAKLHEKLSKKPVVCSDCHQKDSYLNYRKLGFPQKRIDHLVSSEFVGMIDKYKTFYLPSVIDFRGN